MSSTYLINNLQPSRHSAYAHPVRCICRPIGLSSLALPPRQPPLPDTRQTGQPSSPFIPQQGTSQPVQPSRALRTSSRTLVLFLFSAQPQKREARESRACSNLESLSPFCPLRQHSTTSPAPQSKRTGRYEACVSLLRNPHLTLLHREDAAEEISPCRIELLHM